ncbi:MAG TPA: triose-phosphate isomerase [Coriobacteriia bacterium]
MTGLPPLIVVSLKMYLGVAATRAWIADLAGVGARLDAGASIELAVLPTFPLLESTAKTLAGTGIRGGAQDVAASADGAQPGEDDASIQAKVAQVVGQGLVPLYCVGENKRGAPPEAARRVSRNWKRCSTSPPGKRSSSRTSRCGRSAPTRRRSTSPTSASTSESGSSRTPAGPACCTAAAPGRAPIRSLGPVDGLFLGRFAHDTRALAQVVTEVLTSGQSRAASPTSSKEHS